MQRSRCVGSFYKRLGFSPAAPEGPKPDWYDTYRTLSDGEAGALRLTRAVEGWLIPGRNPFGLYLYSEDVDGLAAAFAGEAIASAPEHKPWGMYEFALSDPDETPVRVGWPSRLRGDAPSRAPR